MQCQDEMRKPWFSISWGTTANTNNKPNGNVFALPCFELFHRWPAMLDVILPGWQLLQVFNSRVVQYIHFVKQSWYTKSNQIPIRWSWSSLELICLMMPNHPNLKFLGWFSNIHYESSLAKSQVFFNKRIWGAFNHIHYRNLLKKSSVSSSSSQGESLYRDQSCQYLLESQVGCAV